MPWDGTPPKPSDNIWVGDLPPELTKQELEQVFSNYGSIVECRVMYPRAAGQPASAMVRLTSIDEAAWIVDNLNGNIAEGLQDPIKVRFANQPSGGGSGAGGSVGSGCLGKSYEAKPAKLVKPPNGGSVLRAQPYSNNGGRSSAPGGTPIGMAPSSKGAGKAPPPRSFNTLYKEALTSGVLGPKEHIPDECQVYIKNLPADTTDHDLYKLFSCFGAIYPTGVKAMQEADGSCKGFGFVDFLDPECAAAAVIALDNFQTTDGGVIHCSTKLPSKRRQEDSRAGQGKGCNKGKR